MSLMYGQMGMSVLSTMTAMDTGRTNATLANNQNATDTKLARMTQAYQNTMADISKAQQLNTMTENEIGVRDAAARASQALRVTGMQDAAVAEASAAAAGVRGGSVRSAMNGIERSKLQARAALRQRLSANARSAHNERINLELSSVFNRDVSPTHNAQKIRPPSAASALLGLGANLIDIYDNNQPEGEKSTDAMAEWWR